MKFDNFIIILYVVITAWLAYRLFKSYRSQKKLEGKIDAFSKKVSKMEYILLVLLFVTGIVNLVNGVRGKSRVELLTAAVMIIMALVFLVYTKQKVYMAENGFIFNGSFYTYKELKKWGFDQARGDFVVLIKKNGNESREASQVKTEDMNAINALIRKYKLGK